MAPPPPPAPPLVALQLDDTLHAVLRGDHASTYCSAGLGAGAASLPAAALFMQLARPGAAVLDGAAFVVAAARLPRAALTAAIANTLLECTQEQGAGGATPAGGAHTQHGLTAVLRHAGLPPLFPGAPSLAALAEHAISLERPISLATVELFRLPSHQGFPAYHFPDRRWLVRAAARRGGTLLACLQGCHVWTKFELGSNGRLRRSACSCGHPDWGGALWCEHREGAGAALAADPGLHVLSLDGLEALLAPLSTTQLAQLLLQVALVAQSLPDAAEALGLEPADVFLAQVAGLLLAVPAPHPAGPSAAASDSLTDARRRLRDVTRALHSSYRAAGGGRELDDGEDDGEPRPEGALDVLRFTAFPAVARGGLADAVAAAVQPLSAWRVCHMSNVGVDAADGLPWPRSAAHDLGTAYSTRLAPQMVLRMVRHLRQAGYRDLALDLLQGLTVTLSLPASWERELRLGSEGQLIAALKQAWEECTSAEERERLLLPQAGPGALPMAAAWDSGFAYLIASLLGPFLGLRVVQQQIDAHLQWAAASFAYQLCEGSAPESLPTTWVQYLQARESDSLQPLLRALPTWLAYLKDLRQGCRAKEGTLLRVVARRTAEALLAQPDPLQARQTYSSLILDLQEVVAAEAAGLLVERLEELQRPPRIVDEEWLQGILNFVPRSIFRSHFRDYLVGRLELGVDLNTGGLPPQEQPADLPPNSRVAGTFTWATLRVREMLASGNPRHQGWACAYLWLGRHPHSGLDSARFWSWVKDSGLLGWAAEVVADPRTMLGVRCLLAHALCALSTHAQTRYKYGEGPDRGSLLPSLGFVSRLEALCLRLMEQAVGTVEGLLAQHAERGAILTYSRSLRACIRTLRHLLQLQEQCVYWRAQLAVREALRAHPTTPPQQQQEEEQQQEGGPPAAETAEAAAPAGPSAEAAAAAVPAPPGASEQPGPSRTEELKPGAAAAPGCGVLARCRALLAQMAAQDQDHVFLPGVMRLGALAAMHPGVEQHLAGMDVLAGPPVEEQQQQPGQPGGEQQPPGQPGGGQQQEEAAAAAAEGHGGRERGPPGAAEPCAIDAERLLCVLQTLSGASPAREALVALLMASRVQPGAPFRGAATSDSVTDLALRRAAVFCERLQEGSNDGDQGAGRCILLSVARATLRLVLASYEEMKQRRQRGTGDTTAQPLSYVSRPGPASELWSTKEIKESDPPVYETSFTHVLKLKPPMLLGDLLTPLVAQLHGGQMRGSDSSGTRAQGGRRRQPRRQQKARRGAGEREVLAGMLPLLCQVAGAVWEETEMDPTYDRFVASPTAHLALTLMHEAIAEHPEGLQQLANPLVMRFLTSSLLDHTITPEARRGDAAGRSAVELLAALVCRPEALAAPAAGPAPGASDAPAEPPAKRARTRASSRGAGSRSGGSGNAPAVPPAAAAAAGAAEPAAGEAAAPAEADKLLLLAVGWCQRWLTRTATAHFGAYDALSRAAKVPGLELACPGLLAAVRVLHWWVDHSSQPRFAALSVAAAARQRGMEHAADRSDADSRIPSATSVSSALLCLLKPPPCEGMESVVLAACHALQAMARLHPEDLARSRYIDVLFRAQAGQLRVPTSPQGTPLPLPPGQAKAVMPPGLKSELAQLEQALREQLAPLSPSWAAVLDAHKDTAELDSELLAGPTPFDELRRRWPREEPAGAAHQLVDLMMESDDDGEGDDEDEDEEEEDMDSDMEDELMAEFGMHPWDFGGVPGGGQGAAGAQWQAAIEAQVAAAVAAAQQQHHQQQAGAMVAAPVPFPPPEGQLGPGQFPLVGIPALVAMPGQPGGGGLMLPAGMQGFQFGQIGGIQLVPGIPPMPPPPPPPEA